MEYLTKEEYDFLEWICQETDLSIWMIINEYKNHKKIDCALMLFSLFDKGYLEGVDFRGGVKKEQGSVRVPALTKDLFKSICPSDKYKALLKKWENHEKQLQRRNDDFVSINEVGGVLNQFGYDIVKEDEFSLEARQGFCRFFVYAAPLSWFIRYEHLDQIIKKTHSILLVVKNEMIKTKAIGAIEHWIRERYIRLPLFLEDGNAYSVITMDELKRSPTFPKILPQNSNRYS